MLPPGLHSQQAGTILSTLMRVWPAQPPLVMVCNSREVQVARMIGHPFCSETDSLPKRTSQPAAKVKTPQRPEPTSACRIALIGFGTVGRAVAKILSENGDRSLRLTYICNRNVERKKQPWVASDVIWTDDVESVLKSDVDIVIELIGGLNSEG